MNIFGIGGAELVLIFMIMLVVAGPKRMIRWAYFLGQQVGRLRKMWAEVVDVMQKEVDAAGLDVEIPRDLPTRATMTKFIRDVAKPYTDPMQATLNEVGQPVQETMQETSQALNDVGSWNETSATDKRSAPTLNEQGQAAPRKDLKETLKSGNSWGKARLRERSEVAGAPAEADSGHEVAGATAEADGGGEVPAANPVQSAQEEANDFGAWSNPQHPGQQAEQETQP